MVELREGSAVLHLLQGRETSGGTRSAAGTRPSAGPRASGGRPSKRGPTESTAPTATCSFCGQDFVEDRTQATCQACPLSKACGLMRCPHCGFENARQPAWISRLKEWIR